MLAPHFSQILAVHVGAVALSGCVFCVRGLLRIAGKPAANHPALRVASIAIDTTLLAAAVLLTLIVHRYPFVNAWLTAKVLLLTLYIALGSVALKRARTRSARIAALLAAWTAFAFIIDVAVTRDPCAWLRWLPAQTVTTILPIC